MLKYFDELFHPKNESSLRDRNKIDFVFGISVENNTKFSLRN